MFKSFFVLLYMLYWPLYIYLYCIQDTIDFPYTQGWRGDFGSFTHFLELQKQTCVRQFDNPLGNQGDGRVSCAIKYKLNLINNADGRKNCLFTGYSIICVKTWNVFLFFFVFCFQTILALLIG